MPNWVAVVSDLDIYRSAKLLIDQHGREGAKLHAVATVMDMTALGDQSGRAVWLRISGAIVALLNTDPTDAGAMLQ